MSIDDKNLCKVTPPSKDPSSCCTDMKDCSCDANHPGECVPMNVILYHNITGSGGTGGSGTGANKINCKFRPDGEILWIFPSNTFNDYKFDFPKSGKIKLTGTKSGYSEQISYTRITIDWDRHDITFDIDTQPIHSYTEYDIVSYYEENRPVPLYTKKVTERTGISYGIDTQIGSCGTAATPNIYNYNICNKGTDDTIYCDGTCDNNPNRKNNTNGMVSH